jgi:hypothetical protein
MLFGISLFEFRHTGRLIYYTTVFRTRVLSVCREILSAEEKDKTAVSGYHYEGATGLDQESIVNAFQQQNVL